MCATKNTIVLPPLKIGLYSAEAAALLGTALWRGIDGELIEVTAVAHTEESLLSYKWEDTIRVGWVIKYVQQGQSGYTYDYIGLKGGLNAY